MLTISALLIPFMICLSWLVVMFAMQDKSVSQKRLTALLVVSTIYFYVDAFYLVPEGSHADYKALVFLDILSQFITTALPAAALLYIKSVQGVKAKSQVIGMLYLPGIFLGTAAIIIYSLMGLENAADYIAAMDAAGGNPMGYDAPIYRMHETICIKAYNIIILTEVIITLAITIKDYIQREPKLDGLRAFITSKGKMHPIGGQCGLFLALMGVCALRIGLGRNYLVNTPGISALLSMLLGAIMFFIGYIGTWFSDREFDRWDFQHPTILRKSEAAPSEVEKIKAKTETATTQHLSKASVISRKEETKREQPTLLDQFQEYMETKKPYLNPELNISDVAMALRSNRTYISVLINENFDMSFRDYINKERIKYAKQIMLKNPDEILEVTAEKSGFSGDSQFAKKFKELEGTSPKVWLLKELEKQ